jgi:release factor glutamine methyltransferase
VAVDISKEALSLSHENASLNNLDIHFNELNALKEDLPFENNLLDIIVSNPPYVTENEKLGMQEHVLLHEPHIALFVADDSPFIFYNRIAEQASKKLKPKGWLYFEINEKYGSKMIVLMEHFGYKNIELKADLQGKSRMIRGQKNG